jgi:hypothetical protein
LAAAVTVTVTVTVTVAVTVTVTVTVTRTRVSRAVEFGLTIIRFVALSALRGGCGRAAASAARRLTRRRIFVFGLSRRSTSEGQEKEANRECRDARAIQHSVLERAVTARSGSIRFSGHALTGVRSPSRNAGQGQRKVLPRV